MNDLKFDTIHNGQDIIFQDDLAKATQAFRDGEISIEEFEEIKKRLANKSKQEKEKEESKKSDFDKDGDGIPDAIQKREKKLQVRYDGELQDIKPKHGLIFSKVSESARKSQDDIDNTVNEIDNIINAYNINTPWYNVGGGSDKSASLKYKIEQESKLGKFAFDEKERVEKILMEV